MIKNNRLFDKWEKAISKVLGNTIFRNTDTLEKYKTIFNLIITLQYFDNPYDIHFFLPENSRNEKFRSSLVITTAQKKHLTDSNKKLFNKIINTLKSQAKIEKHIWSKQKDLLPIYLGFKDSYLNLVGRYERLSEIAINIVKAIAYKNEIKFSYELYRVKEFDSFFEKVVKIANDKNTNRTASQIDRTKKFKRIVSRGETQSVGKLCSMLSDVAGARMSCLFQDETNIILNELKQLGKDKEIEIVDTEDYILSKKDDNDYRAHHRVFKLGSKRLDIYEFKDLKDILCELQIRTLLADIWANASHQLFYKKKFPSELAELDQLKNKLKGVSYSFMDKDETLVQIKKSIEKILKELK